mmetsp:Transcript_83643/g.194464  ORF Transcript_83643/g.194464 Transcript_83643/m.194464 type:complete len:205 (+) Transcript_83643:478-1092(+)
MAILPCVRNGALGNVRRVFAVAALEEGHIEAPGVRLELLHGARTEGVASADQDIEATLVLQVVSHLGQVGRLPHAVHTEEDDGVDAAGILRVERRAQHVHRLLGREKRLHGLLEHRLHRCRHGLEAVGRLAHHGRTDGVGELRRHVGRHILRHERGLECLKDGLEFLLREHSSTGDVLHAALEGLEDPADATLLCLRLRRHLVI